MNAKLKVWHIVVALLLVFAGGFFARGIFASRRLDEQARKYQERITAVEATSEEFAEEARRTARISLRLRDQLERDREAIAGLREENTELRERNQKQREVIDRIGTIGKSLGELGGSIEERIDRIIEGVSELIAVLSEWEDQSGIR